MVLIGRECLCSSQQIQRTSKQSTMTVTFVCTSCTSFINFSLANSFVVSEFLFPNVPFQLELGQFDTWHLLLLGCSLPHCFHSLVLSETDISSSSNSLFLLLFTLLYLSIAMFGCTVCFSCPSCKEGAQSMFLLSNNADGLP